MKRHHNADRMRLEMFGVTTQMEFVVRTFQYQTILFLMFFCIFLPMGLSQDDLDPQRNRQPLSRLEPALTDLIPSDSLDLIGRLDGSLQELIHAYIMKNNPDLDLNQHLLLSGVPYSKNHSTHSGMPIVDFTVKHGSLKDFVESLESIDGVIFLAAASTPAYHVVSAVVPIDVLAETTELPGFSAGHAVAGMTGSTELRGGEQTTRAQGSANNQAEQVLKVDELRRVFPIANGSGIRVGTLSDSVDQRGGGISDSQSSADLPANERITVLSDFVDPSATDEGRAMMEHIFDIAPDLEHMGFASAFGGKAFFASNIADLASQGMDIINDDVVNFAEPIFQDGVIAEAVKDFVDDGGIYFSLNHNFANLSYEGDFTDSDNDGYHEYEPGVELASLTVADGSVNPVTIRLRLQWAQPWGNADTNLAIDIYDMANVLLFSSTENNIGGDPFDILNITNSGGPTTVRIAIRRVSGSADNLTFKYILFANGAWQGDLPDYPENATGTLTPHAGTPQSIAIGAAPFFDPDVAETYSGHGPFSRHFLSDGTPITPYTFTKPDFIAVDKCNTTFFGRDVVEDDDLFPNFSGTSAATPNAAAVAALVLDLAGGPGSLDATEMKHLLRMSAEDLGPEGHDTVYGYGRINALGAGVAAMGPRPSEQSLYLDQWGNASLDSDLYADIDIDTFTFSSNVTGDTTVDIFESHLQMDPMLILFHQFNNTLLDIDYNSRSGDDPRYSGLVYGGIFNTLEILSETSFDGSAGFGILINAPEQQQTDRTAFLDVNSDDFVAGSLVSRGDADFYNYSAPLIGNLKVELEPSGYESMLRIYDRYGVLIGNTSAPSGVNRSLTIEGVQVGQSFSIQIVPKNYAGNGSYSLAVDFSGISIASFSAWRRPDRSICGQTAPDVNDLIAFLNRLGCGSQ